jgi:hypothetical protein
MRIIYPQVFDMVSHPISQEQYLETEPKFWITQEAIEHSPFALPWTELAE